MKRQFDPDALVDYCIDRVGDRLQGVYTYNMYGNVKIHYMRDDVQDAYSNDVLKRKLRKVVTIEDALRKMEEEAHPEQTGSPRSSLHTFDKAVYVQLIGHNEERGAVVSFDKDVASRHVQFIEDVEREALIDEYVEFEM